MSGDRVAAAIIQASVARALLRMEGMKACNAEREQNGLAVAYTEAQFLAVIDAEGISHNAVWQTIHDHRGG